MNFQQLLDSNDFLYYPKLSSDIFKAMESFDGVVVLDPLYDEATSNLAKIGILFKACIHTLCLNLSPYYSARFEQVKANILKRDIIHFNYFEKNNAFLNVPEISNLVFTLMNDPQTEWTIPKQPLPNEKTLYNRIAFAFASLRHTINLKLFPSFSKKFYDTTKNITDIIQRKKENKIIKAQEKEEKAIKDLENYNKAKASLISKLKNTNKIVMDGQKKIEETRMQLNLLEDPSNNNFPSQIEINKKTLEIEKIEKIISLDKEIEKINILNETYEKTIKGIKDKISKITNEFTYTTRIHLGIAIDQTTIDELKVYNETLIEHEEELGISKKNSDCKLQELFNLKKDEVHLNKIDSQKKLNKLKNEIEEIKKQLDSDLKEKRNKIFKLNAKLKTKKSKVKNNEELLKRYIENEKELYDKLIAETPDIFSPEIEAVQSAEKADTLGIKILANEDQTIENKEPIEKEPIEKEPIEKEPIEKELIKNVPIKTEDRVYHSTNPFAQDIPLIETKAEPILTKKIELLNIFDSYNKPVSKIVESFLSRFPEDDILSVKKVNDEFKIYIKKPMKLWVPKIDLDDPIGGSILIFENEFHVKPFSKGFHFTKGFLVYSQVTKLGISKLMTANIYNILENQPNNFTIEAGMDIFLVGRQAEQRAIKFDQTIERWGSSNISEVVEGDHVEFLNKKL